MAVSVLTLFLIYVLIVLVVAILLYLPNFKLYNQRLLATFFALIVGAVVITLIPVSVENSSENATYNMLLIGSYLLPIIVLIVIASSLDYYRYSKRTSENYIEGKLTCDETGEVCRFTSSESK